MNEEQSNNGSSWITLAITMNGSIHTCRKCGVLRITINNVVVRLTLAEFLEFRRFIDAIATQHANDGQATTQRYISVNIHPGRVSLLLTYHELLELRTLLRKSLGLHPAPLPEPPLAPPTWPEYLMN